MSPGTSDEKLQERVRLVLVMPVEYLDDYHAMSSELHAVFRKTEAKAREQYERDHDIAAYEATTLPVVRNYDRQTQAAFKQALARFAKSLETEYNQ